MKKWADLHSDCTEVIEIGTSKRVRTSSINSPQLPRNAGPRPRWKIGEGWLAIAILGLMIGGFVVIVLLVLVPFGLLAFDETLGAIGTYVAVPGAAIGYLIHRRLRIDP